MKCVEKVSEVREMVEEFRSKRQRVAFVPTMGALHAGHVSLVSLAREKSDSVILSIFVNPAQFNSPNDLESYPRTLEDDLKKAEAAGVDLVFAPSVQELYPKGYRAESRAPFSTRILAGDRSLGLCGETRPGHFDGVVTVVGLLFNIIQPDTAVFGEKDYQQLQVIQQMVRELHFPVEIVSGPIVRDEDGLALSSRNLLLSPEERFHALYIPRTLQHAQEMVLEGERRVSYLKEIIFDNLEKSGGLKVDYVEIVHAETLASIEVIEKEARLLVAAFSGDVRLIDNVSLSVR